MLVPASVGVGRLEVSPPFGLAPMAGLTDSAFRRMVKRIGGCGLVVTEMVSAEGILRGSDRTFDYAEFTEEEHPVSVQLFGGDPGRMAEAARVLEARGADIVDVNMGCPVPKIARHEAGCRLMREPDRAARIVEAMVTATSVPVTVKMRAGWDDRQVNAPALARRVAAAGASAITVHGRTAAQSYSGASDWDLIALVAEAVAIPVFGNGDILEPLDLIERMRSSGVEGVLVGRGAIRNPWLFAQASDLAAGRPARPVGMRERGRFLLDYIDLLLVERERPSPRAADGGPRTLKAGTTGRDRWVINKLRALMAWYSKGMEGGPRLRAAVNGAATVAELRTIVERFFLGAGPVC